MQIGTPVRNNVTPMEAALGCYARSLAASGRPPLVIGVGEIKDFTGRYSINEGNVITQGGSLMLFSALGKLGGTVRIAERYDSTIADRELGYMERRQLGDGAQHEVDGKKVPWVPYYGGTIQVSDYYIAGGISEVNYNIASRGAEASLNNIGAKGRTYTQSVAIDLRIVDTRTLLVVDAISLSKQFSGYEVGANTFRFFGLGLVDINVGSKGQEPLQLGVRAAIEEAAIRLIGRVTAVDPGPCLALRTQEVQPQTSEEIFAQMTRDGQAAMDGNAPVGPMAEAPQQPMLPAAPMSRASVPAQPEPQPAPTPAPVMAPARAPAPARVSTPKPAPTATSPQTEAPRAAASEKKSLNSDTNGQAEQAGEIIQIPFDINDAKLSIPAQSVLDRLSTALTRGPVSLVLVARDSEKLDPAQRSRLLDQRLSSLVAALSSRGIPATSLSMTWRPTATDTTIYRDGPGVQLLARIKITK
ncbi:CsgG/HfaB family protein [Sphingorhabdus sp.]|uniref:CsgG/HfaB family protein n=1 Tax=Sphingorhabdus sp. TaxID=1902408 RepID=UPI0037C4F58E